MEHDPKRDYSVLTKDDLKEKMTNQINDLSQIFLISKEYATSLLMKLRWDSQHVSERLSENKDILLMGSDYGNNFFTVLQTLARLTLEDKDSYEEYVLRSYVEQNRVLMIKPCPARGCSYVIEFHRAVDLEEYGLNVVCLCGHTFCGRCRLESHRPVTCNNAIDWLSWHLKKLSEVSEKSLSDSWIESNTKPCPYCQFPLEIIARSQLFRFVDCLHCRVRFCCMCLKTEESHKGEDGFYRPCFTPLLAPLVSRPEVVVTCVERWDACDVAMVEAKSELEAFKEPNYACQEYTRTMSEGLMLIVQCRQFLKWSCVYDYLYNECEPAKREYLRFLQDFASSLVQSYSETLKEETVKVLSATTYEETVYSRWNLTNATSKIGNYFFHFTKTLQSGMDEVKVMSYDNFGGPYWLCDRCKFGNTWLDMQCKMCCATATPVEKKLRDLALH